MNAIAEPPPKKKNPMITENKIAPPFGYPRDFLGHRFVYVTISPRARGLSIGVNLTPGKECNFDCAYCEVDRGVTPDGTALDLPVLAAELEDTSALVRSGRLRGQPPYSRMPQELLSLRHVAISGDGEPTLCPQFREAVETVVHVRATAGGRFFKIVLITNGSNLDAPQVQEGLRLLTRDDEIWAKLDVGTAADLQNINRSQVPLEKILANILLVARQRPVVIQSLFPSINGSAPSEDSIQQYATRLLELRQAGAQIPLVQIYSGSRPTPNSAASHLPLRTLSRIALSVRSIAGLNTEVF